MKNIIVIILTLFACPQATFASLEARTDLFASGIIGPGADFQLRTHNALYFGFSGFSLSVFSNYEPLHSYVTDLSFGGGIRVGEQLFFEINGGYFSRDMDGLKGKGSLGQIIFGKYFSKHVSLSLTVIAKTISSGDLERRTIVDGFPYIGFGVSL